MLILIVATSIAGTVVTSLAVAMFEERRLLRRYELAWAAVAAREAAAAERGATPAASATAAVGPRRGGKFRRVDRAEASGPARSVSRHAVGRPMWGTLASAAG